MDQVGADPHPALRRGGSAPHLPSHLSVSQHHFWGVLDAGLQGSLVHTSHLGLFKSMPKGMICLIPSFPPPFVTLSALVCFGAAVVHDGAEQ